MRAIFGETLYEHLGGAETIQRLVEAFYPKVYADPDLALLFPDDVEEMKEMQVLFLTCCTGGSLHDTGNQSRPQLRRRHRNIAVTPRRAQAWLRYMDEAMEDIGLQGPDRIFFYERLTQIARLMTDTPAVETVSADDARTVVCAQ